MRNFIELHYRDDGEPMLVNTDHIMKVFKDENGIPTVDLPMSYIETRESYEEIEELIKGAGVCIDKGDPRLDTKSPLTMEDLKDMIGEPVWNSNTRDWWLIHWYMEDPYEEIIVYNKNGVQESWDRDDLIKTPLYRMKQGMMFISGDNIEVHE